MILVSLGKLLSEKGQSTVMLVVYTLALSWLDNDDACGFSSAAHAGETNLLLPVWLRAGLHL